ncbi:MAG: hypothetical protein Q7R53_00940 [bacterium]|nr:hypothetical protein [bacterium]
MKKVMKKVLFSIGMALGLLVVFLMFQFTFVTWPELPDTYTQTIDMDVSSLAGAEILPREKVQPGTFRVRVDFDEMSGGIATHGFSSINQGQTGVFQIERWKGRGDGVFDYAALNILLNSPPIPYSWLYVSQNTVWTGTDFQVVFVKNQTYWELMAIVCIAVIAVFAVLLFGFLYMEATFVLKKIFH